MRRITSRSYYCSRIGRRVTLLECTEWAPGGLTVCRIMSCSEEESCTEKKGEAEPTYPWGECPACLEQKRDG